MASDRNRTLVANGYFKSLGILFVKPNNTWKKLYRSFLISLDILVANYDGEDRNNKLGESEEV